MIPSRTEQTENGLGMLNHINFGNDKESPQAKLKNKNNFALKPSVNRNLKPFKIPNVEHFDKVLLQLREL